MGVEEEGVEVLEERSRVVVSLGTTRLVEARDTVLGLLRYIVPNKHLAVLVRADKVPVYL